MGRTVLATIVSLLLSVSLTAQQTHQHQHGKVPKDVDGAVSPQLIPDLTAYRMVFLAATADPDTKPEDLEKEKATHHKHIGKIGLNDQDTKTVTKLLDKFRDDYARWIKHYNSLAKPDGEPDGAFSLFAERDALVQSTADNIRYSLSAEGSQRFASHVQNEKKTMSIQVPDSQ
jgi:hypothetical protein